MCSLLAKTPSTVCKIVVGSLLLQNIHYTYTIFIQMDAHAQIDAHPSSSSSSWHTKIGEMEGPGFMWLFFPKVRWARPLHCAPVVELVGEIRTYRSRMLHHYKTHAHVIKKSIKRYRAHHIFASVLTILTQSAIQAAFCHPHIMP